MTNVIEPLTAAGTPKWRQGNVWGEVRKRRRVMQVSCAILWMAAAALPAQDKPTAAGTASVRLLIEDSIGESAAQHARVYDGAAAEFKDPIAESSTPDQVIKVAPGKYWIVPTSDESLSELVTVAAGESKDVKMKVDRGLWITFITNKDAPPEKVLMKVRPKADLENWLKGTRQGSIHHLAQRRAHASDADLETARQTAMKGLAVFLEGPFQAPETASPKEKSAWGAQRSMEGGLLFKTLSVAGKMEDVEALAKMWRPGYPEGWYEALITAIGFIEARHDRLENGKVIAMLNSEDSTQALSAAKTLHFLGLPVAKDLFRRYLISLDDASSGYTPAYWLVDDPSAATLPAMRNFLAQRVKDNKALLVDGCIYLLAHGQKEDWQQVASLKFPLWELSELAFAAEDPKPLIRNGSVAIQPFRDRDPAVFEDLRFWMQENAAQQAVGKLTGSDARAAYASRLNTVIVRQTNLIPDALVVKFYKGFAGVKGLEAGLAGQGSLVADLTWLPYPDHVDLYVKEWLESNTRYYLQLEHIDLEKIEEAVKRLGNGKTPPLYDLYRAYHKIAHTQRATFDSFPMGERRRPYVFAFRERNSSGKEEYGGGISGVASVKAEWQEKSMVVQIKLDQRAHFEPSGAFLNIGGRQGVSEYPHHRYTLNHGRSLIDSVVVRRGSKPLVVTEQKEDEWGGEWLRFVVAMEDPALSDLWVDVNLKCVDQTITLTDGLFAGPVGASLREARFAAKAGKNESTTPGVNQ